MKSVDRLLLLCHGAGNGGAERMIVTLANEFSKKKIEVLLVTTNKEKNDYSVDEKVKREIIDAPNKTAFFRNIYRIKMLRKAIKFFKPQCIISFSAVPNIQAIISSLGTRIPVIISERTDPSKYPTTSLGRFLRNIIYKKASLVVFQTPDAQRYFGKKIAKKSCIIYNPVRDNLPSAVSNDSHLIVGVGSLSEQKDWLTSLKALEIFLVKHSNYTVEIFGDGPLRTKLNEYIADKDVLNSKVFLKGFSKDVLYRLSEAEFYISSSQYEGIPNAMLEAMAIGIPVIQTDCPVGGPRLFIKDGFNGLLTPVNDFVRMAECMEKMASSKQLREYISRNSLKIKSELDITKIINEWEAQIVKCLKE